MRKIANWAAWLHTCFLLFALTGGAAYAGPNDDILAASKAGDRNGVEAALADGASVNARDEGQMTPLRLAAIYGHKNVAELLLDRGANIEARDDLGQTPLHLAASNGNTDVVQLLLKRGSDVNVRDRINATPLDWAAFFGRKSVVALLLVRGALVNARDGSGATPLHYAASNGQREIATLLLAHGADRNLRNSDGQTPLDEIQASTLDDATKVSVSAALQATPKVRAPVPLPRPMPPAPAPSVASTQPTMPSCWDVPGMFRWVAQANPGIKPDVLTVAVEKAQVMMGCRPAPQTTKCAWIGNTWTCKTE
jgi:ankyrin repeat protein